MRRQRNTSQVKEQGKSPGKELYEMEATKILDTVFKTVVIKVLNNFRKKMDDFSDKLKKEIVNILKRI